MLSTSFIHSYNMKHFIPTSRLRLPLIDHSVELSPLQQSQFLTKLDRLSEQLAVAKTRERISYVLYVFLLVFTIYCVSVPFYGSVVLVTGFVLGLSLNAMFCLDLWRKRMDAEDLYYTHILGDKYIKA